MVKVKKVTFICERCGYEKTISAKKIGPISKSPNYPKDWRKVWKKLRVCPNCGEDFDEAWNKYLSGGVATSETKILKARH